MEYQDERRKYPRLAVKIPIRYTDSAGKNFEAYTVNISPYGMLIESQTPFTPENLLKLSVELKDLKKRIDVTSIVTRCEHIAAQKYLTSVAFINLTLDGFNTFKAYVDAHLKRK